MVWVKACLTLLGITLLVMLPVVSGDVLFVVVGMAILCGLTVAITSLVFDSDEAGPRSE